jgi:hypothetical protein
LVAGSVQFAVDRGSIDVCFRCFTNLTNLTYLE